ncbi:UNVERIFIED_CONTAM: amidase [Williamsia faeni]
MSIPSPDSTRLADLDAHYNYGLSAAEIDEYVLAVTATLASSERVEELYNETAPTAPGRAWSEPSDNPLGAWYVTTEIEGAANGPLVGKTVAIKDNISVAGVPMMNGSRTVEGHIPRRDATVVTRLLAAGATITGKAVCEDLCFSGSSMTSQPRRVLNPWDHSRNAGGSSSGSAALVASGAVDLAVGGDQGGSVRIPSSFCGCVGHKPTYGLVPYTGAFPIEQTIDHLGPMTRTVHDAASMLTAIAGVDGLDPRQPDTTPFIDYVGDLNESTAGLKIGIVGEGFGALNTETGIDEAVLAAVDVLRGEGMTADNVSIPWHSDALAVWNVIGTEGAAFQMLDGNGYGMNSQGEYDPELIAHYAANRITHGAKLSKSVKLVGLSGRYTFELGGGKYYAMARNLALELRKAYDQALAEYDVLVMPTVPYTARKFLPEGAPLADFLNVALGMVGNCAPFDVSGHPACSVPTELVDGRPAGLMIIGKRFDDSTVLRVANTYEQARGGFPTFKPAQTVGEMA